MKTKAKVTIDNDTIVAEGDSLVAKLLAGCKGKVKLRSPFGNRELKLDKSKQKG